MPAEPDHKPDHPMGDLLKAYARKRRDEAADPMELHPVTRRLFQDEVARLRAGRGSGRTSWLSTLFFSPRWVGAAAVVLVFGVGFWSLVKQQTSPTAMDESASPAAVYEPVADAPGKESDRFAKSMRGEKVGNDRQDPSLVVLKDAQNESQTLSGAARSRRTDTLNTSAQEFPSPTPEKADRNEPGKKVLDELEIVAAQKSVDEAFKQAAIRPADTEVLQLEKKMANEPAEFRELDQAAARRNAVTKAAISNSEKPAGPVSAPAPTLAKAKSEKADFGNVLSDPQSVTSPSSNLLYYNARSLAYSFDSSGLNHFPEAITNSVAFASASADQYFLNGTLFGTAPGYLSNSAFGLSQVDGSRLTSLSAALPVLSPAEPLAAVSGFSRVSGIGGAAALPGSGADQRLNASAQPAAQANRQSQRFHQTVLAADPLPARPGSQPMPAVLASFEFQQEGEKVRVIDADGSIYEGQLGAVTAEDATRPTGSPAVPSPAARAPLARREQAERPLGDVTPSQSQLTAVRFRLVGTNRTLQQSVIFEGAVLNDAPASGSQQKRNEKIADDSRGVAGQTQPRQISAQQIRGILRVGGSNAVPVEAIAVGK